MRLRSSWFQSRGLPVGGVSNRDPYLGLKYSPSHSERCFQLPLKCHAPLLSTNLFFLTMSSFNLDKLRALEATHVSLFSNYRQ